MKLKVLMVAAAAALSCAGMSAINNNIETFRIYINPGHGSWGPNNRPCQTIGRAPYSSADPDTTGFFEANTNMHKCFSLLDHLVEAGVPFDRTKNQDNPNPARRGAALDLSQNIVMSHVMVGPYPYTGPKDDDDNAYNRPLSEISEEVERNNFDVFISIHSNAADEGSPTNYPLILYRGSDEKDEVPGSKELGLHIWPYMFNDPHKSWTFYAADKPNVRGDWDFYHSHSIKVTDGKEFDGYLGVLKHGALGFLIEGYFHTYQPARQRAMNDDVCRHEGQLYARGLINYMGWKAETTGDVYGIVRDLHEKFTDKLYKPQSRTNDVYKPLNGVVVTLHKDGQEVATYTTDNEWNGAFIFEKLEPGEYSVSFKAEGYKAATEEYTAPFTVKANETTYLNSFLESESWVPPTIVYVDYPNPLEGNPNYILADEYNMQQVGADLSPLAEQLKDKTVRRQIVRDGYVYVLALDANNEPFIYSVNLEDNSVAQISTEGLTLKGNRTLKLSDIAISADNVLCGINFGLNQFSNEQVGKDEVRGIVKVFKWAKDETTGQPTGNPVQWFSSKNSGNYYYAMTGLTIAVKGTTEEGVVMTTASTTGSSSSMRFVEFAIANGELAATTFINKNVSADSEYTLTKLGEDHQLVVSPVDDNRWVIDGNKTTPVEFQSATQNVDAPLIGRVDPALLPIEGNGATFFKYANANVMVAPAFEEGKLVGVKMLNVTNGLDKATEIVTTNTSIAPEEVKYASATGRVVTELNSDEQIVDVAIELTLVRDGKISIFSTKGVDQPVVRGHYAYDLNATVGETSTTFTFKSTGDVDNGQIILKDVKTNEVAATVATGAIAMAENTVTIENSTLPEGEYAWEVQVEGNAIPEATRLYNEAYPSCRGIIVDNNPNSAYFGTVYVSNTVDGDKAKGIWKYDKQLQPINTTAIANEEFSKGNTASPYRLGMMEDGSVLISDWSDSHAGLFRLTPENDEVKNMFVGTRDATGAITNNGKIIGGGTTCAFAVGTGANTSIYSFVEDYPVGNGGNKLVRYDIGEARTIENEPNKVFDEVSAKLANTNVEIYVDENGVWAAQTRFSPNSTPGVPALLYFDFEGNILYNSGESNTDDMPGNNGSGVSLNSDRTKVAVASNDGGLSIYDITRDGIVPTLKLCYTINCGTGTLNQIAFDPADNVYLATRKALQVWALPTDKNVATTPAAKTIVISNEGSVEENAIANETRVYPNPAEDVVYVEATEEIENIAIFNVAGAAVNAEVSVIGNQATIQVAGLASGVYFVKINNGEAVRVLKK